MFDFEKLTVYKKSLEARKSLYTFLAHKNIDKVLSDQLKRAILSIILNIAEGTGKSTKADKKNFFTIARGSTYEVVAILDILRNDDLIHPDQHQFLYSSYEEISKMLLGLINSLRQ